MRDFSCPWFFLSLLALSLPFFPLLFSLGGIGRGEREGVGRVAGEEVGTKGVTVGVTREVAVVTAEAWKEGAGRRGAGRGGRGVLSLRSVSLWVSPSLLFFSSGPDSKVRPSSEKKIFRASLMMPHCE